MQGKVRSSSKQSEKRTKNWVSKDYESRPNSLGTGEEKDSFFNNIIQRDNHPGDYKHP